MREEKETKKHKKSIEKKLCLLYREFSISCRCLLIRRDAFRVRVQLIHYIWYRTEFVYHFFPFGIYKKVVYACDRGKKQLIFQKKRFPIKFYTFFRSKMQYFFNPSKETEIRSLKSKNTFFRAQYLFSPSCRLRYFFLSANCAFFSSSVYFFVKIVINDGNMTHSGLHIACYWFLRE